MVYEKQNWQNFPDTSSPITAARLNHMEEGIFAGDYSVQKNQPGGLASLDSQTKLLTSQMPDAVLPSTGTRPVGKGEIVYNAVDYGLSESKTADQNGLAIAAAAAAADGGLIWVPKGRYLTSAKIVDSHFNIAGPGQLIQDKGKPVIEISHTYGSPIPVTVSTGTFGPTPGGDTNALTLTTFAIGSGSYADFQSGEVYHLESRDAYPWAAQDNTITDPTNVNVWKAEYVPVLGIGIDISASTSSVQEGRLLVGATSGASARIDSVFLMQDGTTRKITVSRIFKASNGASFAVGENLLYNGTSVGVVDSLRVVMHGAVSGAYVTTPNLRKLRQDLVTQIETTIDIATGANSDDFIGVDLRSDSRALYIRGVYNPQINVRIKNSWARGVVLQSCYRGSVVAVVDHLPNHATEGATGEMAYGYGVEALAATSDVYVRVIAHEVRHAFTTNSSMTTYTTGAISQRGTPKRVRINGDSIRSYSAGWDTHPGAEGMWFENVRSVQPGSGARFKSAAPGLQDRSFGTMFTNCEVSSAVVAIALATGIYTAEFANKTRIINLIGRGIQRTGYSGSTTTVAQSVPTEVEFTNTEFTFDGLAANLPYYQIGFKPDGAVKHTFRNCRVNRCNGAPIWANNSPTLVIDGLRVDYSNTTGATGIRVDTTMVVAIRDYGITGGSATYPSTLLRNASGDSTWELSGSISAIDTASPPLMSINAGTPKINWRERPGKVEYRSNTNYTYAPGQAAPVHVYNSSMGTGGARLFTLPIGSSILDGETVQVVRTAAATGTTTLTLTSNGVNLKQVEIGTWTRASYDGTAWIITSSGSL